MFRAPDACAGSALASGAGPLRGVARYGRGIGLEEVLVAQLMKVSALPPSGNARIEGSVTHASSFAHRASLLLARRLAPHIRRRRPATESMAMPHIPFEAPSRPTGGPS